MELLIGIIAVFVFFFILMGWLGVRKEERDKEMREARRQSTRPTRNSEAIDDDEVEYDEDDADTQITISNPSQLKII